MTLGEIYYSFSVIIVVRKIWKEATGVDTGTSSSCSNETSCFGSQSFDSDWSIITIMRIFALNIGRQSVSAVSHIFPNCVNRLLRNNVYTKITHSA